MTVQELIDALKTIKDKSLIVAIEADHGQCPMNITHVGVSYVEDKDDYMMTTMCNEDEEGNLINLPEDNKIILIQAY